MALMRRRIRVSDKIPTASMADIAFLLLIFFLTSTVFDEEMGLRVVLPEKGPEAEVEVDPDDLLFFIIQPDGALRIRRGENPAEQTATSRQVEAIMRQALTANPDVIAVIQTSPEATYEHMINVLDGIQSAGADRYSLQLRQE